MKRVKDKLNSLLPCKWNCRDYLNIGQGCPRIPTRSPVIYVGTPDGDDRALSICTSHTKRNWAFDLRDQAVQLKLEGHYSTLRQAWYALLEIEE